MAPRTAAVSQTCCCLSVRIATIALAVYHVVMSILLFVEHTVEVARGKASCKPSQMGYLRVADLLASFLLITMLFAISLSLLIGVVKSREKYLLPFLSLQVMDYLLCLLTLLGSYIELPAYLKFAARRRSVRTTRSGGPLQGPPADPAAAGLLPERPDPVQLLHGSAHLPQLQGHEPHELPPQPGGCGSQPVCQDDGRVLRGLHHRPHPEGLHVQVRVEVLPAHQVHELGRGRGYHHGVPEGGPADLRGGPVSAVQGSRGGTCTTPVLRSVSPQPQPGSGRGGAASEPLLCFGGPCCPGGPADSG